MECKSTDARPFVKTGEAARLLGVHAGTVRAAVARGDLPGIRLGSTTFVSRVALLRLISRATGEPAA